jgi:hypothetical protein
MAFASTNSVDVCTGTIVKAILFEYLDSSWDTATEVHCINGRTPVTLPNNILRINRMKFLSNCETHINTGHIWLGTSNWTDGVPVNKYGHILSGTQQTYQGFYSVPRGHTAKIYDLNVTVNEGKSSNVWMHVNDHAETFSGFPGLGNTYQHKNSYDIYQTVFTSQRKIPLSFGQMSDIEFRAQGSIGGDVNLGVEWTMLLTGSSYIVNDNR